MWAGQRQDGDTGEGRRAGVAAGCEAAVAMVPHGREGEAREPAGRRFEREA